MLQVGELRIHLINDSNTIIDPGGMFGLVPRVLWSKYAKPTEDNLIHSIALCLLVQTGSHNIVIDTGHGQKMTEKERANWHLSRPTGDLIAALSRLDLSPEDIDLVIDTHLHGDHCSGNTYFDENGEIKPTFPNAEYLVQRREYEDASNPNERTIGTYYAINWDVLFEHDQMRLLDGDTEIVPGIWGIVSPGHTPGHMAIRFESQGKHAAFLCDMASFAVHFERLAWMTAYDIEPLITLETKREWQKWALQTNALLMFPHDPTRPIGRLTQDERGRPYVKAIDEPFV